MNEEIGCFGPNDRLPENSRAAVTGYSGRSTTSTTGYAAKRWSDDPWYDLRPEQAWRAGWEAAKVQAVAEARRVPIPESCSGTEAYGRLAGSLDAACAIEAMEPPA